MNKPIHIISCLRLATAADFLTNHCKCLYAGKQRDIVACVTSPKSDGMHIKQVTIKKDQEEITLGPNDFVVTFNGRQEDADTVLKEIISLRNDRFYRS